MNTTTAFQFGDVIRYRPGRGPQGTVLRVIAGEDVTGIPGKTVVETTGGFVRLATSEKYETIPTVSLIAECAKAFTSYCHPERLGRDIRDLLKATESFVDPLPTCYENIHAGTILASTSGEPCVRVVGFKRDGGVVVVDGSGRLHFYPLDSIGCVDCNDFELALLEALPTLEDEVRYAMDGNDAARRLRSLLLEAITAGAFREAE